MVIVAVPGPTASALKLPEARVADELAKVTTDVLLLLKVISSKATVLGTMLNLIVVLASAALVVPNSRLLLSAVSDTDSTLHPLLSKSSFRCG